MRCELKNQNHLLPVDSIKWPMDAKEATEPPKEAIHVNQAAKTDRVPKSGGNGRLFLGSRAYVDFFNNEVEDFFGLQYANDSPLAPSTIGNDRVSRGRADSGVFWSSDEKERFFRCLARYSIHRTECFRRELPEKSEASIIAYYMRLRRQSNLLKNARVAKTVHIRRKGETEFLHREYTRLLRYRNCVRYSDIPAAYDVSGDILAAEETQARHIIQKETISVRDTNQYFKALYDEYVAAGEAENDTAEGEDEVAALEPFICSQDGENGAFGGNLIDPKAAQELSDIFYVNNSVTERLRRIVPKLHMKSLVFMEELTKLVTTKVVLKLVEQRLYSHQRSLRSLEMLDIKPRDVYHAVNALRLYEVPNLGHRTYAELAKKPFYKLQNYFNNIVTSLGLKVLDDHSEYLHKYMKLDHRLLPMNDAANAGFLRKTLPAYYELYEFLHDDNSYLEKGHGEETAVTGTLGHVSALFHELNNDLPLDLFTRDDITVEKELLVRETERLEQVDALNSAAHMEYLRALFGADVGVVDAADADGADSEGAHSADEGADEGAAAGADGTRARSAAEARVPAALVALYSLNFPPYYTEIDDVDV